jgi:HEPN domain-containing protein
MVDYPLIHDWFRHAENDYKVAEHLLLEFHPVQIEIICFHCQQAAEKWLKGYLVYMGTAEIPKTHELNKLRYACADFDPRFEEIAAECDFLTQFGVTPRYPDEWEVIEQDARRAVDCATMINNITPFTDLRNRTAEAMANNNEQKKSI